MTVTNDVLKRAQKFKEIAVVTAKKREAQFQIDEIEFATKYAEPGYTEPECGVIALGDWNNVTAYNRESGEWETVDNTVSRLADIFEKMGIELEWSESWRKCDMCLGIVRIHADSYCWMPSYHCDDEEFVCVDCLLEGAAEYLQGFEGKLKGNSISAICPENYDYLLIQDRFEHGFHTGQDASPERIAGLLDKAGCTRYLFNLDSKGQFDIRFSVWLHEEEKELLEVAQEALRSGNTDGPSVSAAAKRALEEASRQASELKGDGCRYSKIDVSAGTVKTRLVTEEEFVRGIKDE